MADEILDRWIDVGDIRTHYLTLGNGAPIVLLHSGALGVSAAENWQKNIPALARGGFSVYAPEIVGSGETDKPAGCHAIAAKIRHIEGFIDKLCFDRVCLVGNALGASLALAIANDLAARVAAVIVMGGPGAPHGREPAGLNRLTAIADAYSREEIRKSLAAIGSRSSARRCSIDWCLSFSDRPHSTNC
jgi:pimeloyl-ACP methyl ester carboxylesterase